MTPEQLERARGTIEPRWDGDRAARVHEGLPERARRRRRQRLAVGAGAGVLVAGLVIGAALQLRPAVELQDLGAAVWSETREQDFRVITFDAGRLRVVARQPVKVRHRDVELVVSRGVTLVELIDGQLWVVVEEGEARLRGPAGDTDLTPGQPFAVPARPSAPLKAEAPGPDPRPIEPAPVDSAPDASVAVDTPRIKPPRLRAPRPAPVTPEPAWKRLASEGDFTRAWDAMQAAPPPRDEAAELLLAADVARLSHHPEAAVAPLERVLSAHRGDARAALAAFTLGRVLLDDLGRPREALRAFETARTLAPSAPLAEDALARQVEAASRAQDPSARPLAEQFLQQFPESPRARSVRHFGGVR